MSRYKPFTKFKTINDIYGNELGNFFSCISIKDYEAKIEICGDAAAGITATADMLYMLCNRSGLSKERLFDVINRVWEEHDVNESNNN